MAGLITVGSFMLVMTMVMLRIQGLSDVEQIEMQARRYEEYYRIGNYSGVQSLYTEDCRLFFIGLPEIRGPGGEYIVQLYVCMYTPYISDKVKNT